MLERRKDSDGRGGADLGGAVNAIHVGNSSTIAGGIDRPYMALSPVYGRNPPPILSPVLGAMRRSMWRFMGLNGMTKRQIGRAHV